MPIVSISLNEILLEKLEEIEKDLGYSGRSEVIRTAVRNFIDENEELNDLEGTLSSVITVKYTHDTGLDTHKFQSLINSQLHSHDNNGNCLQVFIVEGPAAKIVQMKEELESKKNVSKVDLSI